MPSIHSHHPQEHLVQLYGADERGLIENVGRYLAEGVQAGAGILVIATADHWSSLTREMKRLGVDAATQIRENRLVCLNAQDSLSAVMAEGRPDWDRFEALVTHALAQAQPRDLELGWRAYGEMVGLLWKAGQFEAALEVETLWNRLLASHGCNLFCAYPIDVFGDQFRPAHVDAIFSAHSKVVSSAPNGDLVQAVHRAIDDTFGTEAPAVKNSLKAAVNGHAFGEAAILALQRGYPEKSSEVLAAARHYYEEEKRFRALIEHSSDAIFLVNRECKILYASASTRRVLGYDPEELIGTDRFQLIHPEDRESARAIFGRVLREPGVSVQLKARVLHRDRTWRWVESNMTNLLDEPDVRAIVSNYRDITDRQAAEEAARKAAEDLARNFADLQAFSYAAAHDLKEPIRTVSAYTDLLLHQATLDDTSRQFAELIIDSARHMSSLLDDLLALASLSFTEERQRVDLHKALDQAISNLRGSIEETSAGIHIENLPAVSGYENQLVQVFQNLLSNAIKYRSEKPIRIRVSASQIGREWIVKVADNGMGIDPKYHDYVFGVFKRLHNRQIPGTGIGLAICKKIVEGLGGRIWVESEPGKGSTFCFKIAGFREQVQPDV